MKTVMQVGETNCHLFHFMWITQVVLALLTMQQCCLLFYKHDVVLQLTTLLNKYRNCFYEFFLT